MAVPGVIVALPANVVLVGVPKKATPDLTVGVPCSFVLRILVIPSWANAAPVEPATLIMSVVVRVLMDRGSTATPPKKALVLRAFALAASWAMMTFWSPLTWTSPCWMLTTLVSNAIALPDVI
jgi:hypothetical protein